MKGLLYLIVFLISLTVFAQQKTIEATNIRTGKIRIYEENQRVKIRTLEGKKYVGKLKISDSLSFTVDKQSVKIDSLYSIKSQPKVLGTVKTVVFATGLAVIGSSIILAADGDNAAFLLFSLGTGITLGAVALDGIKANNSNINWTFKIIEK
jgi:small nuclear ribonucleoprotein (snRNP)-like protein